MKTINRHICIILSILLCSCGHQKNKVIDQSSIDTSAIILKHSTIKDTLRDTNHFYFLADIDPKIIARLFIKDSISPTDNYITFRVMDSINARTFSDRQYYLTAFSVILEKADGALGEAVGQPAMQFVENHTKEFFEIKPPLTKLQFESWASNIGIEIFLSSSGDDKVLQDGKDFIKKLKNNCKDCSPETLRKIKEFELIIMQTIKENNK